MAKTDFSSSSPLAGSFLTGHIDHLPPGPILTCGGGPVFSYFCSMAKFFVRVFYPAQWLYCACGFCISAWAYDNEAFMS